MLVQYPGAQHWRESERNKPGHDDRNRDAHRKLTEDPPDHPAHEKNRNKHRNEREGDGNDREADLARAFERGFERPHAAFDVPHDVLEHDDGVIDHESYRQRQCEQRHVVDGESEHVHRGTGADQRDRNRQGGNNGGGHLAQKQKDDHHHEADRDRERLLHIGDRLADGNRAIVEDLHADRGWHYGPVLRQPAADRIHDCDRIGVGLALDGEHNRTVVVEPARDLVVLHAVNDVRNLLEVNRSAVAVGHDHLAVFLRFGHGGGGRKRHALLGPVERADGCIGVGFGDDRANILERDVARGSSHRIDLHPDGEFLRAIDEHLGHAGNLRDLLGERDLSVFIDDGQRQGR